MTAQANSNGAELQVGESIVSHREPRALVVTKMWPTPNDSFRNGFLKLQVDAVRRLGVECDVLVIQDHGSGPLGYLRAALAVRRASSSGGYDVVHAHYGLTGLSCLLQDRPLVVTLHGSDINGAVDIQGRRTRKGRLEAAISRAVARRADAVIAVSARMVSLVSSATPIVVPIGIDTELFRPIDRAQARRELCLEQSRRYILFAANPENPIKRHWLAEQAVAILQESHPEAELLTVFGEPFDRMPLWMNAADALLITSVYEGGPMVHREAMACNLPVVSVDVGDVAFHLEGVAPSRVAADDPLALADAIRAVIQSDSRSDGRRGVDSTTMEATAEAIRSIYRRLEATDIR